MNKETILRNKSIMMEDRGLLLIQPKRPAILIIHFPEATNYRSLLGRQPH